MSNAFAVTSLVANTATQFMENECPVYMTANKKFQAEFDRKDLALGGNLAIKFPGYPNVQYGLSASATSLTDLIINYNITEDDIRSTVYQLNVNEEKFDIVGGTAAVTKMRKDEIVDNYAWPAMEAIKSSVEADACYKLLINTMYTPIYNRSLLGGVNSFSSISQMRTFMDTLGLPRDQRYLSMNFSDAQSVANSQQNQFNPMLNKLITDSACIGGSRQKARFSGFDMYQSSQLNKFVAGPLADVAGITVSSVSADGTQVVLTGVTHTTGQLINAGDMIAIPSVNLLNVPYKNVVEPTLVLRAVTDANGDGSGNVTVTLPFPLLTSTMQAWIDALPEPGAPVQVYPSVNQNYGYTPSGISMVSLLIGDIAGAENSVQTPENNGRMPFKVIAQGAALTLTNNFRITNWTGIQAFTPYVVALPSLAA